MNLFKTIVAILFLASIPVAQGSIRPPQPNYSQYGSYSRQLAVYEATQLRINDMEIRKYRKFREEVRRQTALTPRTTYIVRRHENYYYDSTIRIRSSRAAYRSGFARGSAKY